MKYYVPMRRGGIKWALARNRKRILIVITGASFIVAVSSYGAGLYRRSMQSAINNQPGLYAVASFEDGDTIIVDMNGTLERIRFIGVDTPETQDPRKAIQCYGKAASAHTKQTIGTSKVRLVSGPDNTNRDRYGRLLRYVYLPNGRFINAELVNLGYGFAYTGFPFSKIDEFKSYQQDARKFNRGLWGICNPQINIYGGYTSDDAP